MKDINLEYERMVVVFLDILGTKSHTSSFDTSYKCYKIFHEEFDPIKNKEIQFEFVPYTKHIFSFSDCTYIVYQLKDDVDNTEDNILKLLITSSINTVISLTTFYDNNILLRGGICVGDAFVDKNVVFGPAVNNAYRMENSEAVYPRVIIDEYWGKKLYSYFEKESNIIKSALNDPDYDSTEKSYIARSLRSDKQYIVGKDESDSKYFLNVFELSKKRIFSGNNHIINIDKTMFNLLKYLSNEFKIISNDRVKDKFTWMINYIENGLTESQYLDYLLDNNFNENSVCR